jgi:hypothetical protein
MTAKTFGLIRDHLIIGRRDDNEVHPNARKSTMIRILTAIAVATTLSAPVAAQTNTSTIVQDGRSNTAVSAQRGRDNLSTTVQRGRRNAAGTVQCGIGRNSVNNAGIGQTSRGGRNTAVVAQDRC